MTLYHVTTGEYDDYGTFAFVEGPEGAGTAIQEGFGKFSEAVMRHRQLVSAVTTHARAEFQRMHGDGPQSLEKFSVLHPTEAAILSVGKRHPGYVMAKDAETKFLARRQSRAGEIEAFGGRERTFIAQKIQELVPTREEHIRVVDFLPAGCKVVQIENIHCKYIPYTSSALDG